jgi:glutamyl-tRNA synthetase
MQEHQIAASDAQLRQVIPLVKERCTLLDDFAQQAGFFFVDPQQFDLAAVQPKWSADKAAFFRQWAEGIAHLSDWSATILEQSFKSMAEQAGIKTGELMLPLRVMLVGGKFGPPVFEIAAFLGRTDTIRRIHNALEAF